MDLSKQYVLDAPSCGDDSAIAGVFIERRYDDEAVTATIRDKTYKTPYFYSSDGGDSWHQDNDCHEIRAPRNRKLHEAESRPYPPIAANGKIRYRAIYHSNRKIFTERSTDGGITWMPMKRYLISGNILQHFYGGFVYHPKNPMIFCVIASLPCHLGRYGMFMTDDGGDIFSLMYTCDPAAAVVAFSKSHPNIPYGTGRLGSLLKSTNGGKKWDLLGQNDLIRKTRHIKLDPLDPKDKQFIESITRIYDIAIDADNSDILFVATSKGLLISTNEGDSWCRIDIGTNQAEAIRSIVMMPNDSDTLFIGTVEGLLRSKDRGRNWERIDVLARIK